MNAILLFGLMLFCGIIVFSTKPKEKTCVFDKEQECTQTVKDGVVVWSCPLPFTKH